VVSALRVFIPLTWLFLSSCASIMNGDNVDVPVETDPVGATVTVKGREYISPVVLQLKRGRKNIDIKIEKEG